MLGKLVLCRRIPAVVQQTTRKIRTGIVAAQSILSSAAQGIVGHPSCVNYIINTSNDKMCLCSVGGSIVSHLIIFVRSFTRREQ